MAKTILPVIMCGGAGTRVWPESRETMPKQFIALIGAHSTFQETVRRVADPDLRGRRSSSPIATIAFSSRSSSPRSASRRRSSSSRRGATPARRSPSPPRSPRASDPETVVAVFASDHVITKQAEFLAACAAAAGAAEAGLIVTLGVTPTEPATGYGYIKPGAPAGAGALAIEAFVEKPDRATAERYVAEGYLWNSGNFFFRADAMREEIAGLRARDGARPPTPRSTRPSAISASSCSTARRSRARRRSRSTMR